jgi:hypothetical protein
MNKKILGFLMLFTLAAGLLSACKPKTDITSGVSPADMIAFLNKKGSALAKSPGWLQMTENITYDVDRENLGTLPDGRSIPLQQVSTTWYHINTDGLVYQYVNIMKNTDGEDVQVSVFVNYQIANLTTGDVTPITPYSLGGLDYLFASEMKDFMDNVGGVPELRITDMDSREVAIFTLEERFDPAVSTENYEQPVYGSRTIAYFDYETGVLFRLERIRIFKDGSERTFFRTELTVEKISLPPQNVLDYVEKPQLIGP